MILMDGAHHAVDSSEMAFRLASIGAVKQGQSQLYKITRWFPVVFPSGMPCVLEPVMAVEVNVPDEFQVCYFLQ